MTALHLAWRRRGSAISASLIPFLLMIAIWFASPLIQAAVAGAISAARLGISYYSDRVYFVLLDAFYWYAVGLFVAVMIELFFSDGLTERSWNLILPSRPALLFALALTPIGAVASVLDLVYGDDLVSIALAPGTLSNDDGVAAGVFRLVYLTVNHAPIQWLIVGPLVPYLAVKCLELPSLGSPGGKQLRAVPSIGYLTLVLITVVAAGLVDVGLSQGLSNVPILTGTWAPSLAAWYFSVIPMLTIVAAAAAVLLARNGRRRTVEVG